MSVGPGPYVTVEENEALRLRHETPRPTVPVTLQTPGYLHTRRNKQIVLARSKGNGR